MLGPRKNLVGRSRMAGVHVQPTYFHAARSAGPILAALTALTLAGCGARETEAPPTAQSLAADKPLVCDIDRPQGRLVPAEGVWLGVNLDWGKDSPERYTQRLGFAPAVVTSFSPLPIDAEHSVYLDDAVKMLAGAGGMLLLTLEPHGGLDSVTSALADDVASRLARYNAQGVPVLLRFAHEMNGGWYAWGQQPTAYIAAYRRMAAAVHRDAPGTAMLWAPNYGGGYPFSGTEFIPAPAGTDGEAMDTDGDGKITGADDPYAPYYPGDDAVDWVGMSLYHWGADYPWGSNDLPEAGKFEAMLTGTYRGSVGDQTLLPDFYRSYGEQRNKPVGIFETAAFYAPAAGGADEFALKSGWWRQVFAADIPQRYPKLKMINWFEWDKHENEVGARVDWGVTVTPDLRDAFLADLPDWLRHADAVDFCRPAP